MIFVDTNYFLRFLLKDIENQYLTAKKLMADAVTGKSKLFTSTIVFFELYWVLSSYYKKNKTQLIKTLLEILDLSFVELEDRFILHKAVLLFNRTNLCLEDCYNLNFAKNKGASEFKTFDKKLAKIFTKSV